MLEYVGRGDGSINVRGENGRGRMKTLGVITRREDGWAYRAIGGHWGHTMTSIVDVKRSLEAA